MYRSALDKQQQLRYRTRLKAAKACVRGVSRLASSC